MKRLMENPHRTARIVGALVLVFLVGTAAVRWIERPAATPAARESVSALDARLGNAMTRLEESVAAARAEDTALAIQLAALDGDARALAAAAADVRRGARGFRSADARDAAAAAAEQAQRAAVAVRTASDSLAAYASGALGAAQAISGVELAVSALAEARLALAPTLP